MRTSYFDAHIYVVTLALFRLVTSPVSVKQRLWYPWGCCDTGNQRSHSLFLTGKKTSPRTQGAHTATKGREALCQYIQNPWSFSPCIYKKHNTRIKKRKWTRHKWSHTYRHKTENMVWQRNPTYGFNKKVKVSHRDGGFQTLPPSLPFTITL